MFRRLALVYLGLLSASPLAAQQEQPFHDVIAAFLAQAPMQVSYRYTITHPEFSRDTSGVMVLIAPGVFRLELWDKVLGSDGDSIYLHDRNTRQTVIDSLRWTEVNLWVRLIQGELPPGTTVTPIPSDEGLAGWSLAHDYPGWRAVVRADTSNGRIVDIRIEEQQQWEHIIRLDAATVFSSAAVESLVTLQDLPGTRLDLR